MAGPPAMFTRRSGRPGCAAKRAARDSASSPAMSCSRSRTESAGSEAAMRRSIGLVTAVPRGTATASPRLSGPSFSR